MLHLSINRIINTVLHSNYYPIYLFAFHPLCILYCRFLSVVASNVRWQ
nr:MAG TPA: hypothetical protein [Caudoviricetes sp.]